jgi:hypothetical protein
MLSPFPLSKHSLNCLEKKADEFGAPEKEGLATFAQEMIWGTELVIFLDGLRF